MLQVHSGEQVDVIIIHARQVWQCEEYSAQGCPNMVRDNAEPES